MSIRFGRVALILAALVLTDLFTAPPSVSGFDPPIGQARKLRDQGQPNDEDPPKDDDKKKEAEEPVKEEPAVAGFKTAPDEKIRYEIDTDSERNQISFTSKAPRETIKGKVEHIEGYLEFNPHTLQDVDGKFTVKWSDVTTGKKMRDEHMRADPWVNSQSHPEIVFTVKEIEKAKMKSKKKSSKGLKLKLNGEWTMNGETQDVSILATVVYLKKGQGGEDVKEGVGIKAGFPLALEDYKIVGKADGDKKSIGAVVAEKQDIKVSLFLARPGGDDEDGDQTEPITKKKKKSVPAG